MWGEDEDYFSMEPNQQALQQTAQLLYILRDPTHAQVSSTDTVRLDRHAGVDTDGRGVVLLQYTEANQHLDASQTDPNFVASLAFILSQATPDQVRAFYPLQCT